MRHHSSNLNTTDEHPRIFVDDPSLELQKLYRRYFWRNDLDKRQWDSVVEKIDLVARRGVAKVAGSYKVPSKTREELIEEVRHRIGIKFFQKKFGRSTDIRNFQALLRTTTFNTTISSLRSIKSLPTGRLEVDPTQSHHARSMSLLVEGIADPLVFVRSLMPPFRFPECSMVRDFILAYRLGAMDYPAPDAIRGMVPSGQRQIVFMAAVADINEALMAVGVAA